MGIVLANMGWQVVGLRRVTCHVLEIQAQIVVAQKQTLFISLLAFKYQVQLKGEIYQLRNANIEMFNR